MSETPTPFAVTCNEHGLVYLSYQEYMRQLSRPDSLWRCPICKCSASWSDENYEARIMDWRLPKL